MDVSISRNQQVLGLLKTASQPFTVQSVTALAAANRISYGRLRKFLHYLEKEDHLVRLAHGVYMTMEAYMAQKGSSS